MSSYDHTLLGDAPAVTKQMRQVRFSDQSTLWIDANETIIIQEGYNPDLLQSQPPQNQHQHQQIPHNDNTHPNEKSLSRKPFWQTTKGIIIIAVVILVVIGAVVGGAVGGTVGKDKHGSGNSTASGGGDNSTNSTTGNSTSSATASATGGGQEVGQSSATASETGPGSGPEVGTSNAGAASSTTATGSQSDGVQQRRRRH
ncbi:hypothetical protein PM082_004722 [Marasmius tenuissimus]|nr:hypothetical protein PM082_004722 [Marasmius tenuissimus]